MSRTVQEVVSYPGEVEDSMPEGNLARWLASYLIDTILRVFGVTQRHAAYANLPIYYVEGNPKKHVSPDAFLLEGVPHEPDLKSYRLWETGVVPCVAFEILSLGSKHKDRVKNREIYAQLGIEEYYWFDPANAKLEALRLDRRTGRYETRQPDASGRYPSPRLGLEVGVEGRLLALYDRSGYLPPTAELLARRERENRELQSENTLLRDGLAARDQELAARDQELAARDQALSEERLRREELERRLREFEGRK